MFAFVAAVPTVASAMSAAADTQVGWLNTARFCKFTTIFPIVASADPPFSMVTKPLTSMKLSEVTPRVVVTVHTTTPMPGLVSVYDPVLVRVQGVLLWLQIAISQFFKVRLACCAKPELAANKAMVPARVVNRVLVFIYHSTACSV